MRTAVVVEVHGLFHGSDHLCDIVEDDALEQLVLHCVVDALRLRIILRIAAFSHTDGDAPVLQELDIIAACILHATVGVVYEADTALVHTFKPFEGHSEGLHRINGG